MWTGGTTTPPANTSATGERTEQRSPKRLGETARRLGSPARKSGRRRPKLYGMSEYLMIAYEMEKARLLARKAREDHHRKERSSPNGSPPEGHNSASEGDKAMYPGTREVS